MTMELENSSNTLIDAYVEAFESARGKQTDLDLGDFAPPSEHPLRGRVACELVRVDLEYGWRQGQPRPLEEYGSIFPELVADAACLHNVAFEEYRLRDQALANPTAQEYRARFGIDTSGWPPPHNRPIDSADASAAH